MLEADVAFEASLRRLGEYFMGISPIHRTAEAIALRLREAGIDFAMAGALALNVHGVMRATEDVDILITRDGLRRFKEEWLGRGYVDVRPGGKPVRDTETRVKIDFLLTGDYPGDGKPKPVAFPDPRTASSPAESYPVVALPRFVELKLASGMTAKDRPQDFADVIRLIRARSIAKEFSDQLDPYVGAKYVELWEIAQAPADDY